MRVMHETAAHTIKVKEVVVLVEVGSDIVSRPCSQVVTGWCPLPLLPLPHSFVNVQGHAACWTGGVLL